jgi:hypothetical protein
LLPRISRYCQVYSTRMVSTLPLLSARLHLCICATAASPILCSTENVFCVQFSSRATNHHACLLERRVERGRQSSAARSEASRSHFTTLATVQLRRLRVCPASVANCVTHMPCQLQPHEGGQEVTHRQRNGQAKAQAERAARLRSLHTCHTCTRAVAQRTGHLLWRALRQLLRRGKQHKRC